MKFIAISLGLIAIVSAVEPENYKLPQDKVRIVQKIGTSCAEENNIDPAIYPRIADGMLPRDEPTNKYLYCITTKLGMVDESGHMVVDKIVNLLGDHPLAEDMRVALHKCNEVTKENPVATVVEMNRCLTTTTPVRFVL